MGYNEDIALEQLTEWQERVNEFGGRYEPSRDKVRELADSLLGRAHIYRTSQAVFDTPTITLAEMKLKSPIAVDLVFSYENARPPGLQSAALPAPASHALDPGDGFLRITWGSPGGTQHVAEVDGNHGWRHPFVASSLKLEYVPVDPFGNGATSRIPGGQPRDLMVKGLIAPRNDAPTKPLTRTTYMPFAFGNNIVDRPVPSFASSVRVLIDASSIASGDWRGYGQWLTGNLTPLNSFHAAGNASLWPAWPLHSYSWPVPQRAGFLQLVSTLAASVLDNPMAVYELSL